jgi:hypothetical protein
MPSVQPRHSDGAVTPPGAAQYAGPSYLKAAYERDNPDAEAWIDCGDDAGLVLRAIKAGWSRILFNGRKTVTERVADICAQHHVEIRPVARLSKAPAPNSPVRKARKRS